MSGRNAVTLPAASTEVEEKDYLPPCITSPGIAAVVHRRLNELYFAHLLEALHSSASGIGASFTTTSEKEDSISNEILEYLAFCVAFSREGYLWPKKDPSQQFLDATARIHDGYAIKLVQDIIAELKTLGYHWEISPDGYNWAAFAEEQAARKELAAEADHYLQGKTPTCA